MEAALEVFPHDLRVNRLPAGEKEFFCFIHFPNIGGDQAKDFSWRITAGKTGSVNGQRQITQKEHEQHRITIASILPAEFAGGELTVDLADFQRTWQIHPFEQKGKFRLPFEGQVLVVVGHRIGELHRSGSIASEHFAWDLVPLHKDGLRLLRVPLSENLLAQDFACYGQPVLAPGEGVIVKAVDGMPDLTRANEMPTDLDYYREDLNRALGNYVVIEHGDGVWSFLAHFKNGSVQVRAGQKVKTLDRLGELGNSGFSTGPHIHFHFMDGPEVLSASPLPIELDIEAGTYAPQAGEITAS